MAVVDDASGRLKVAEKELYESRFSAAVWTDDEYLLAALDLEIQFVKKSLGCRGVGERELADVEDVVSALKSA